MAHREQTKRYKRIVSHATGECFDQRAQMVIERLAVYQSQELEKGELPVELFYSGKVSLSLTPELHEQAAAAAKASSRSLNRWLVDVIHHSIENPIERL